MGITGTHGGLFRAGDLLTAINEALVAAGLTPFLAPPGILRRVWQLGELAQDVGLPLLACEVAGVQLLERHGGRECHYQATVTYHLAIAEATDDAVEAAGDTYCDVVRATVHATVRPSVQQLTCLGWEPVGHQFTDGEPACRLLTVLFRSEFIIGEADI